MTEQDSIVSQTDDLAMQQQALLDFAVSHSPAIFYLAVLEADRPVKFISANVETITGHTAGAFLSESGYGRRFVHPDDLPNYARRRHQLMATGTLIHEYRFRNIDGEYLWFRDELRLVGGDEEREIVGCMIDITQEKRAEAEREQLAHRFQDAIESVDKTFNIIDADGRIIACNSPRSQALGIDPKSFIGKPRELLVGAHLSRMRSFGGEATEDTEAWVQKIIERAQQVHGGSFEIEYDDDRWNLISFYKTSDGGQVSVGTDITELKHAERELRQSEQHFRRLVENHPLPVTLTEFESGRVLYASPSVHELTGTKLPEGEHFAARNYADPIDRERLLAEVRSKGGVFNWPVLYKRDDGSTYWVALTSRLIKQQGREMLINAIIDLTEQHAREEALRQAHETLEDAVESLSEGFALYDAEDRLVMCNSRYREFNKVCADIIQPGMSRSELMRTGVERGEYGGDRARIERWLERYDAARVNTHSIIGHEHEKTDGEWFTYSSQPTRQGGRVSTLTEITERKEMEQALRESEASIRLILEACPIPIAVTRASDGSFLYQSPASKQLFNSNQEQPELTDHVYYVDPSLRERGIARLRRGQTVDDAELTFKRQDGSEFNASVSARLIELRGEEVVVSAIRDLSERIAMEEEMARQRDALHQSEKLSALGELLASVAHELNNPLSVVVGQSVLLQEAMVHTAAYERAERIRNAAERCARIVKSFLAMARQQPQQSRSVKSAELIAAALELTTDSLEAAEVAVSTSLPDDLPAIFADSDQLTQVFSNLLVNADYALREVSGRRKLWISARTDKARDEVVVEISDNGPGIPDNLRHRVFEPFFTTKAEGAGTGIGLALCHRILESHGGRIRYENTPGGGATFVVRLPISAGHDIDPADAEVGDEAAGKLRVLVIDDEPEVAELLADILDSDGHLVEIVDSGDAALNRLAEDDFDVILSDLRMPGMDGPELFRRLEALWPDILDRIAFVTGDTLSTDIRDFLECSGQPYLEKPITPQDVRDLVKGITSME